MSIHYQRRLEKQFPDATLEDERIRARETFCNADTYAQEIIEDIIKRNSSKSVAGQEAEEALLGKCPKHLQVSWEQIKINHKKKYSIKETLEFMKLIIEEYFSQKKRRMTEKPKKHVWITELLSQVRKKSPEFNIDFITTVKSECDTRIKVDGIFLFEDKNTGQYYPVTIDLTIGEKSTHASEFNNKMPYKTIIVKPNSQWDHDANAKIPGDSIASTVLKLNDQLQYQILQNLTIDLNDQVAKNSVDNDYITREIKLTKERMDRLMGLKAAKPRKTLTMNKKLGQTKNRATAYRSL